jgi:hypothetical protein
MADSTVVTEWDRLVAITIIGAKVRLLAFSTRVHKRHL